MRMSACRHTGDRSWKNCAAICCGLHWLSNVWSVFPAVAAYRMKTPWRDGTTHVVMSDAELVEKLAALVPAPRFHLVRYFGILASAAKQRASVVPSPPPVSTAEPCGHRNTAEQQNPRPRNYYVSFRTMSPTPTGRAPRARK
jgi:hypothetical protein